MAFSVLKWFLFVYTHLLQLLSPCISLRDSYTTLSTSGSVFTLLEALCAKFAIHVVPADDAKAVSGNNETDRQNNTGRTDHQAGPRFG